MNAVRHRQSSAYENVPIVGATATYYTDRNDPRFETSLETVEAWRDSGQPLVIADGSPEDDKGLYWTQAAYEARGAVVLPPRTNGIASQRQQAARHILRNGGSKILTHEPEKLSTPHFAGEVADKLASSSIVVIGRTDESLESLPPTQRRTEALAGWILECALGLPSDALAGPRGYNHVGAQYLLDYPSHDEGMNNWIYMYKNPLDARNDGHHITSMKADIVYPESMVAVETDNPVFDRKRYEQFVLQLDYLLRTYKKDLAHPEVARLTIAALDSLSDHADNHEYDALISDLAESLHLHGYESA